MASTLTTAILLASFLVAALPIVSADAPTPGEFVVGFHDLPDQARAGEYGDERVVRVDETLGFAVVHARNAEAFELRARHDPNVRYVQAEQYASVDFTPNDPYYAQQFGLARINAPAAWDVTRGSTSVVVAIVDTGVDAAHPDLAGALLPGYDFQYNDATPQDDCGHGTGVTGVVAARSANGLGVAGTAQVSVMPLKAMGMQADGKCYGPFSAVASSIRYAADNGARVISMSLGCMGCYDAATNDAINYAYSKGVLLVGSAGNNGPCTNCVSWPAAHPNVIAVSATDSGNAQAYFSSAGPQVEVAAPGKSIYTTMRNGLYGPMSGTSLAAPFVSGSLALAMSAQPTASAADLRARLSSTAQDLGAAGKDDIYGAGLVNLAALVGSAPAPAPTPPANVAPTASFTATATGLSASVDANASSDSDGRIVEWRWSWGDGIGFSTSCAWAGHTYAASGTYTITLTVVDDQGATATTTRTLSVVAPNAAPTAQFSASASDLTIATDARASADSDGSIASYAWSWGDGATGAGATASHAYASAGTYTVRLTVTDDRGAQSSSTQSVTVTAPAPAPAPAPEPKAHVGGIDGTVAKSGKWQRMSWTVSVLDASNAPISGATVTASIGSATYTATTGADGTATFLRDVHAPKRGSQTYTLCVSGVSLSGWTYDASANVASCKSLTTI